MAAWCASLLCALPMAETVPLLGERSGRSIFIGEVVIVMVGLVGGRLGEWSTVADGARSDLAGIRAA